MTRLLFVCLGNICRSPTAEAVMKEQVDASGYQDRIQVDSAGTLAVHQGERADQRMRSHASKRGYDLTSISRPVVPEDFDRFDHILAMDAANLADLRAMAPDQTARDKISLFLEWDADSPLKEVPDPYYGGSKGFEEVLDLVEQGCEALLSRLTTA